MTTATASVSPSADNLAVKAGKAAVSTIVFVLGFVLLAAAVFVWTVLLHNTISDPKILGPVLGITGVLGLNALFGTRRR